MLVAQPCPILLWPHRLSLSDSSVHGILQARILGWVAISSSRGSSWPMAWTPSPTLRQILYCLSQSVIPSKFQQALLWKLKADSNIYIEMQMPRIATMFLKENEVGEKSCCWDMRHTKKWGRWSRRRKGERGEKDGGLLQACGRWWVFRGHVQRADLCVLPTPGAPYLVLAVKCPWKQALNQALNRITLRVVLKVSETERGEDS